VLRLVGYSDALSAEAGETIRFMVSCDHPSYESRLVRLRHGDTNPAGPGFRQVEVPSSMDGTRRGKKEHIRGGSFARLPVSGAASEGGFTFAVFMQAWNPGAGEQVVASRGSPYAGAGWAVVLADDGSVAVVVGASGAEPARHKLAPALHRWQWYFLAVAFDPVRSRGWAWVADQAPSALGKWGEEVAFDLRPGALTTDAPLVLAAVRDPDGTTSRHFDGKLDRPRVIGRALQASEVMSLERAPDDLDGCPGLVGAWDFSADISTDRVSDASANANHGHVHNMPTRAVAGYNHTGSETSFRLAPGEYGAIHFHRDDLEDAGWAADFEFVVPADLPSGVYAAWLTAGEDEEYLPFVVRPPRGRPAAQVAVLLSTMTYVAYANFTDIGKWVWRDGFTGTAATHPYAEPDLSRSVFRYIDENSLYGTYDTHVDGSGTCYGSLLRPILNMRPKFRYRTVGIPARFAADLYLVDWLEHRGVAADFVTDHDLHAQGAELLGQYRVILSSSHHEYWTAQMMDGLETYLAGGGRFMYLGGNGLFGVVSVDPAKPHKIEIRRWGTGWPFEAPPAERYHSTTGEPGGTWRNRGRPPNAIVGVGTAGATFDRGSPYERMPDALDPRVRFVFEGLGPDELIGDVPSLQLRWGAAGYEFDRFEPELGSPANTLVLASSVRFNQAPESFVDDQMWFAQGRDGHLVDEPQLPGRPHRFIRSDLAYLEYPNGGAVFSAGAISWCSCLSAFGYDNSVARVTANVLDRFAGTPHGSSPSDRPAAPPR
jgi:N,N-dimethylformamidase